jgi:valyl-tRNA synthetase
MDSKFIPANVEEKLYREWEEKKLFEAQVNPEKKPFSIILPPPNANGFLHVGHAMYVYEDILIRYHKMMGYETLWLPGTDHAGIETQYVFEKQLQKEGKSRFDFDRETLFKMIWEFVSQSQGNIQNQVKRLGFALDWSKEKYTMDPKIIKIVYETFKKMFDDGLVYRDKRLVNYCTKCGTGYSDLEVNHVEQNDPLYYMKYGPFVLATVRPETKFGDTAVAVNPKDKRYKKWIGKEIEVEGLIGPFTVTVIGDDAVDPEFGTGVVKVTPAHDFNDFEMGKRHNLAVKQVIGFDGKLNELAGSYAGLRIKAARAKVVEDLTAKGLIDHVDEKYVHSVGTCYRCGTVLEPLPLDQWYIKVQPLTSVAVKLIKEKKIQVHPKKFEQRAIETLENFIDWNISRQNVWGIRIPAYFCASQKKWFVSVEEPDNCELCGEKDFTQDPDIFDTWFSSSQWPFATLQATGKEYYDYFYPTTVMETGYDILRAWVSRMMMVGHYVTGKVPFEHIFLHGMVRDKKGQKMSKSKGNVINPLEMVDKYGADALRSALIFGTAEGNDTSLSEEKIVAMRNFSNKVWNIGRFIKLGEASARGEGKGSEKLDELSTEWEKVKKEYHTYMKEYKFSYAFGLLYEFLWHRFADYYIEQLKEELKNGNIKVLDDLKKVYGEAIQMLHPFTPFVTEALWKVFHGEENSVLTSSFSK